MNDFKRYLCTSLNALIAAAPIGRYAISLATTILCLSSSALGQSATQQASPDQEMRAIDNLLREVNDLPPVTSNTAAIPGLTVAQVTVPTALKQDGPDLAPTSNTQAAAPLSSEQTDSTKATGSSSTAPQAPEAATGSASTQAAQQPSAATDAERSNAQSSAASTAQPANSKQPTPKSFLEEVIDSNKGTASIWQNLGFAFGILIVICLAAYQYSRSRSAGQTKQGRAPKALQLVATLPISPKRQVLLIRVRDTEIAVASTEHGLSLLSEVRESNAQAIEGISAAKVERLPRPLPVVDGTESIPSRMLSASTRETKSEILKKALESIESKRARQTQVSRDEAEDEIPLPKRDNRQAQSTTKPTPTENQTTATLTSPGTPRLKKFFANSYKQSNDRDNDQDKQTTAQRAASRSESASTQATETASSQTDNVAQLIRDKLKQMRAIN
jgi:flagellar biogenesis protein FliO